MERRLAAILAADMVGYSRLMEADEEGTIARHKALRAELIDPKIAECNGRIVKTTGDGLLIEFASVVDAVRCAVEVQQSMAEREVDIPDHRRIRYRVGVNLGDIVIEGDDILGDGVNIAARLEGLAEPGGIAISGKVRRELEGKLALRFTELGEKKLKNIERLVTVHTVEMNGDDTSGTQELATLDALLEKPAVAVLPFNNLGGDPEQDYFCDGLTEDIITLLAAWRTFPVIARNSTFAYKGSYPDIRQVAKELNARYVIEGSVRRAGDKIRTTAQLIDAETGLHIWAEKFDGTIDDIFEMQDRLTHKIVATVEPEMQQAEVKKSETRRTSNLSAWERYLRGMNELYKMTEDSTKAARAQFEAAVELDPDYSDAYAGISWSHQREMLLESTTDRQASRDQSFESARRAVELDKGSSIAHLALSGAYIWSDQHQPAVEETRLAMELNPSNVNACQSLGNRLDIVGNPQDGIPLLERSLKLNPRDPMNPFCFVFLGRAYINLRDYETALGWIDEAIRHRPQTPHAHHMRAICLGHMKRFDEAREAAAECERIHPGFIQKRADWNIYLDPAANEHLLDGLRKAGII